MNLIPKIAELLGVEVGEEFKIKGSDSSIFKLEGTGLFSRKNTDDSIWCVTMDLTLRDIIVGVSEIEKIPFEPKNGERYWYVYWNSNAPIDTTYTYWYGAVGNLADKYCGNCFRTEAEAEREKYNIYEKLTGKKWDEVADETH